MINQNICIMCDNIVCIRVLYVFMFMSVLSIGCSFLYCPFGGTPFLGKPFPFAGPFPLDDCGRYCG